MTSTHPEQRPNPFPGLRPFRSDEHHLFFGREDQTAALLQLLRKNRFLAVVGTSGSGKSSLVRAGMIAELHSGTMTQAGSTWEVIILRPGGSPIENLARAFVDADHYDADDSNTLPRLLATLSRSRFGLVEAVKQSEVFQPETNLLVVVDQFEELFRFRQQGVGSEEAAAAFVNLLLTACEQAERPIYVAITMRSDYLGDCSEIPGLAEAVNAGEYLIPRLLRDQKRDAIEKPIGVGGAKISPMLVQRLLNDVGDDPDQLPVLQHALMRMWEVWFAGSDHTRPIDFCDFEATGGLAAALSNHADEIHDSLPDDRHRKACERLFKTLTEKGADNRGIRRPTRLAQLTAIAGEDHATVAAVLDAFRQSGVTFLMPGVDQELEDKTVLDLSHESLMRGWQRLRGWVEDEAQSARIFRRLSDTAALWRTGKAGLFRDPDLQIALSWREQEHPNAEWAEQYGGDFDAAIAFLEKSNADVEAAQRAQEAARQRELQQAQELAESRQLRLVQQQRSARRLRSMIAGLAVVAAIAVVTSIVAGNFWQQANVAKLEAEQSADLAKKNAELAKTNAELAQENEATSRKEAQRANDQTRLATKNLTKAEIAERLAREAEQMSRNLVYATDMELAAKLWADDQTTAHQFSNRLVSHVPQKGNPQSEKVDDLRGFEWHYYQHLLDHGAAVISGLQQPAIDIALTAKGQLLSLDEEALLSRWNTESRLRIADPLDLKQGHRNVGQKILSPDGGLAALVVGKKVHILNTTTGEVSSQIDAPDLPNRVYRLILSPDSQSLIIVNSNKVEWRETSAGKLIAALNFALGDRLQQVALSSDGLTLAVARGSLGNEISIFRLDAKEKKAAHVKTYSGRGTLGPLAFTPDGDALVFAYYFSGELFLLPAGSGDATLLKQSAHASAISAIALSQEGTLATGGVDGTIKTWTNPRQPTLKATLRGHQDRVVKLLFSSAGELVSAGADKTLRIWQEAEPDMGIRRLEGAGFTMLARFSPDGLLVATTNTKSALSGDVRLWDAATGRLVRILSTDDKGFPASVAFSPNGRTLAAGYGGAEGVSHILLWDVDSGRRLAQLPGTTDIPGGNLDPYFGLVSALAYSPDGKYLVAGFGNKRFYYQGTSMPIPIKVWNVATGQLIRRLEGHTNFCVAVTFSPDGSLMASASYDGTVRIWNTRTWKTEQTLKNPDPPTDKGGGRVGDVAFSPDGQVLAMASHEGNVVLWDVKTWKQKEVLKGHSSAIRALAFSPNGRTLASGGDDSTIRLWNVATWRELIRLQTEQSKVNEVYSLAFSLGGENLLAGGRTAASWTTAPVLWDDPNKAALKLAELLDAKFDFRSRIRLLSSHPRLHEGLEKLQVQRPVDVQVQAALAATRANWFGSLEKWPEAVQEFDRLLTLPQGELPDWLTMPDLVRFSRALHEQGRVSQAAILVAEGVKRSQTDGLANHWKTAFYGVVYEIKNGEIAVSDLVRDSNSLKSGLRKGDVVLRINEVELTAATTIAQVQALLAGDVGTTARLKVRHPGGVEPVEIQLVKGNFLLDFAGGEVLREVSAKLVQDSANAELLELRAELNGLGSSPENQLADYDAALKILSEQPAEKTADALRRLYRRRGDLQVAKGNWQLALDDYAKIVTDDTQDEELLANQALARANVLMARESLSKWTVLKPAEMKSTGGAILTLEEDGSIFVSGNLQAKETYTLEFNEVPKDLKAIRLEALRDDRLPSGGPGTHGSGNFVLSDLTALRPDETGPAALKQVPLRAVFATFEERRAATSLTKGEEGWSIGGVGGATGKSNSAFFAVEPHESGQNPNRLRIVLDFYHEPAGGATALLGRFRFSFSSADPNALVSAQKNQSPAQNITDPWANLAAAYRLQDDQPAIDQLVARRPQSAAAIGDLFAADKQWQRAIEIYTQAVTEQKIDVNLLSKRAQAHEAEKAWDAAAADWSRAASAAGNSDGALLRVKFASRLSEHGQSKLAATMRATARQFYEQALLADPGNVIVAEQLTQLLLDSSQPAWTVLKPAEMKSKIGATLTLQPDGSILASGNNSGEDTFTFATTSDVSKIAALRLEALPHSFLPGNGPGRHPTGWFKLSNVRIFTSRTQSGEPADRVQIADVAASYQYSDSDVVGMIHEKQGATWHTWTRFGQRHEAVFSLASPVGPFTEPSLTIQLAQTVNLGCFRLSASSDPKAFEKEQTRFALADNKLDPWLALAAAYALNGETEQATKRFAAALDAAETLEGRREVIQACGSVENVLAALHEQRPKDLLLRSARAKNFAKRGMTSLAQKRPAQALAELQKSRDLAARLLSEYPKTGWVIPKPIEMKSAGGATLTLQSDGSILASGTLPDDEVYTITLPLDQSLITSLRLEILPHPSLKNGAAGREPTNGTALLSEISIELLPAAAGAAPVSVPIRRAMADHYYQPDKRFIENTIDRNPSTHWTTHPEVKQRHFAVFELEKPLENKEIKGIRVTLDCRDSTFKRHSLGCFRLSVSGEANAVTTAQLHKDLAEGELADIHAAIAKALAQQGKIDEAAKSLSQALGLATDIAAKAKMIAEAQSFPGLMEKLAEQAPDDAQVQSGLTQYHADQGNRPLAQAARAKGLTLLKRQLAAKPEDAQLAEQLAQLLLRKTTNWTVLKPVEMTSEGGATLTRLEDDSILASGKNPDQDSYTISVQSGLGTITALRLEALPDPSLPDSGPGRAPNFVLTELEVLGKDGVAEISGAEATHEQRDGAIFLAEYAADHKHETGWAIQPRIGQASTAYFQLKAPLGVVETEALTVVLHFKSVYKNHNLGRFRLSVTDDPADRNRLAAQKITEPWAKLATAYHTVGDQSAFDELIARKPKSLRGRADYHSEMKDWKNAAADYASLMKLSDSFPAAMVFDGRTTQVTAPHVPFHTYPTFTIEAWVLDWTGSILELGNADKQENNLYLRLGKPSGWKSSEALYEYEIKERPESLWNHVAMVYDGKNQMFFLNGELVSSSPAPIPGSLSKSNPLLVGGRESNSGNVPAGSGLLAALRISSSARYKQAFTPEQELASDAATVLLYDLAQPNPAGLADLTGQGRYGSITGPRYLVGSDPAAIPEPKPVTPDENIAALGELIAASPENPILFRARGDLNFSTGKWQAAVQDFSKIITPQTTEELLFARRAEAHQKLEQWELAAADWGNADLHALDKKFRYGNPSYPYLEHRFYNHGRLQQYDQQVLDCTELLKPERLGNEKWIFVKRGETYDRMRQWGQARADYDQAIKISSPAERGTFQYFRGHHFAAQGQWKLAAEDMKQAYQNPTDSLKDFWPQRNVALIHAITGDVENWRKVAAEFYSKQSERKDLSPHDHRWLVSTLLLFPDMVTSENRPRLLEMAGKIDPYWQPRLTAALHFRSGEHEKAAELFQSNLYGPQFSFLAAMNQQKLGQPDLARRLLSEGNSWVREQSAKDPGTGVPSGVSWDDWAYILTLQYEAFELIQGPAVSAPRKLALKGQTAEAAEAYTKALAEAADKDSKSRIMEELIQFDVVLTALHRLLPDDAAIQEAYRRMVERTATEFSRQLDALTEKEPRSQLISLIIRRQDGVWESLLKLRPEDTLLQAGNDVRKGDWKNAAANYSQATELNTKADSIAWMVPPTVWAYAGETERHRELCQKMYERYRNSISTNDTERFLKMLLLVENGPELPSDSVNKFYDSIDNKTENDRVWFLSTRALLECRKGNYAEAHKWIDEALTLEKVTSNNYVKLLALAVQSLTYARQKDVAKAQKSLDQVKQLMSQELKMKWKEDGLLDGSTILNGDSVEHDKLIPEIIRREAERLLPSAAGSPNPKTPVK